MNKNNKDDKRYFPILKIALLNPFVFQNVSIEYPANNPHKRNDIEKLY